MLGVVTLSEEVDAIAATASLFAATGEKVVAVLVAEPIGDERLFLCAFDGGGGGRTWLALSADGVPIRARDRVREAVSIAALCELAEASVGVMDRLTPRVASPEYLDELGGSRTEVALALQEGLGAVEELTRDVEAGYKLTLS